MKGVDYIKVTNKTKIIIAINILRDVGLYSTDIRNILCKLEELEEKLFSELSEIESDDG